MLPQDTLGCDSPPAWLPFCYSFVSGWHLDPSVSSVRWTVVLVCAWLGCAALLLLGSVPLSRSFLCTSGFPGLLGLMFLSL